MWLAVLLMLLILVPMVTLKALAGFIDLNLASFADLIAYVQVLATTSSYL